MYLKIIYSVISDKSSPVLFSQNDSAYKKTYSSYQYNMEESSATNIKMKIGSHSFLYNISNRNNNNLKVVICAIAKNENDYINDWCHYHFNLGFDEIYIYDNNDEDFEPIEERIDKDILSKVHIIKVPGKIKNFQYRTYTSFTKTYNQTYDWCAFIDIDEFFVLKNWKTIKNFLSESKFRKTEVIRFEWHLYGDNDDIQQDTSIPIYQRITKEVFPKFRGDHYCKSIVRGYKEYFFNSAHYPLNKDMTPCYEMTIDGKIIYTPPHKVKKRYEEAYIAHYITKTLDEFLQQKFKRVEHYGFSNGLLASQDPKDRLKYFFLINEKTPQKVAYIKEKLNINI